jgi:hypothetical protein
MKNNKYTILAQKWVLVFALGLFITSCDSFLDADPSTGSLTSDNVFVSDATASSAVSAIYASMMSITDPFTMFNGGLGVMGGLSADELNDYTLLYPQYQKNQIPSVDPGANYYMWSEGYKYIYQANSCINGIIDNTNLTESTQKQLLGESYFLRALSYFYLTNLYGDVPLVTGTNYKENMIKPRTKSDIIYSFIQEDLLKAEGLLSVDYPSADRARINKYVVQAFMARVNLYLNQYEIAKNKASEVIAGGYQLSEVNEVFKSNSTETIWQLVSVSGYLLNTYDANFYNPENAGRPTYTILDNLYNSFEAGDDRKTNWIKDYVFNGEVLHYSAKYTQIYEPVATEYNIMFRLAEQYLIRAEAEANLDELTSAIEDLDKIRLRANLGGYIGPITKPSVLAAIAKERRNEFFTEHGHRWFDLKRNNTIDAVLGAEKPATWKSSAKLWPVPRKEINANSNLLPNNEGY